MSSQISNEIKFLLDNKALQLRIDSIRATTKSKSGHPTSCLSAADIISALFFYEMKFDLKNPKNPNNDRFILSKGHAIPVVYAAWKQLGVISDEELLTLREFDSVLEGHPTPRFKYNEAATGSLGQGLSIGAGMALNAKLDNLDYTTYVMMGDGEIAEGSVWEAAEFSSHYKLDNLIGIVDCNRLGQSGESINDHHIDQYAKKFEAFGWHTFTINGHAIEEIIETINKAKAIKYKPVAIIAKTYKGYGLEDIENKNGYHGKPLNEKDADQQIHHLEEKFYHANIQNKLEITIPEITNNPSTTPNISNEKISQKMELITQDSEPNKSRFDLGEKMATREAFGHALASLGDENNKVVVLDADVKNSTYTNIFEKKHPSRFFQCYIAEQNMVSVATGLELRDKIPFAATFASFFSRAFDQIRMAGVGKNALRLSGSHCGVSIGEDGPSQMGLEDIAMMRSIPNSVVLYPSDAVSAFKLTYEMANKNDGLSYLRTTRGSVPTIYNKNELFPIGGCKILKQKQNANVCIIAAGITLHEALKSHDMLEKEGIFASVIDLYSVKPLPKSEILDVAKQSNNKIIIVEDHYLAGGIGEAIKSEFINEGLLIEHLYVDKTPRSATPEELLAYEGIDAAGIMQKVKAIV